MGWKIGVLGFDSRRELGIFLFTTVSRTALGSTKPPIQWVRGFFPRGQSDQGVKLTTHIHLVLEWRMRGAIPPLPQYIFMEWCLVKHRDNFTFRRKLVTKAKRRKAWLPSEKVTAIHRMLLTKSNVLKVLLYKKVSRSVNTVKYNESYISSFRKTFIVN
jgi:hypothetical protein